MSENKVVDVILHCQKQFKKERLPEEKILHYLGRLCRLRVSVQDLAETGIGRTVNSLSRNEGPVGQAAERLVRSWKQMVSAQQNQASEHESEDESDSNTGTSEDEETRNSDSDEHYDVEKREEAPPQFLTDKRSRETQNAQSEDQNSGFINNEEDDDIDDIEDPYMENGYLSVPKDQSDDEQEEEDDDGSGSNASDRLRIADDDGQDDFIDDAADTYIKQEPVFQQDLPVPIVDQKEYRNSKHPQNHHRSYDDDNKMSSSRSHQQQQHEREREKSRSSSSHVKSEKDYKDRHRSSSKHQKEKESSDRSSKRKERFTEEKSHQSKSDRYKESKSYSDKSISRDKVRHTEGSTNHEKEKALKPDSDGHHRSSKSNYSNDKNRSSSPGNKKPHHEERKRKDHEGSQSSQSSSSGTKKSKLVLKEEIDSSAGVNFADVLGCLNDSPSKLKKLKKEEAHSSSSSSSHSHSTKSESSKPQTHSKGSHSKHKEGSSSSSKHDRGREREAEVCKLSKKSGKIESVIKPVASITPHYKPSSVLPSSSRLPETLSSASIPMLLSQADFTDIGPTGSWKQNGKAFEPEMSQEDAISTMLSSRNARSKVYSGVKVARKGDVPRLYDLCMQVIKDNIGDLGFTGGIPYDILKPALERANPDQLMQIETQNDYLIGETDELWQFHCKRDFRGKVPDETESWRELYERCTEEQRIKLEKVKKQMKRAIESAEPIRKAKLAYVETTCGGTRFNKQKAQTIKNGMKTLKIMEEKGPNRGVSSSASVGFNNPKASDRNMKVQEASVIIAPESRAGHAPAPPVSRESTAKLKPKKAPLMQKTMKLMRSLNRR